MFHERRPFLLITAVLLSLPSVSAHGAPLTQEGAVARALKHNPALAAARLGVEEARGRVQQSGRMSNPELEVEWNRTLKSNEAGARVSLMQRFPITGRLRYEKAVSRAQLSAAELEVREAERRLAAEVRALAVKLMAIQEQRELRSHQIANIRVLSDFLRKSAEAGEGAITEALQVELEARLMEIEKLQIAADESALLAEFRSLLGASPGEYPTVAGKLTQPSSKGSAGSVGVAGQRPDVMAAKSRVEAARFALQEQKARRSEDIGAGLTYSHERVVDDPNPLQTDRTVGFRVSIPLPFWNNNAGRIQEAGAAVARSEKEADVALLSAAGETEAARQAMDAYSRIFTELDLKALPQAAHLEEQVRVSHHAGHAPLSEVLRTRSRHLEIQRQRLDVLRDYHLARIRYGSAGIQPSTSK